MTSSGTFLDSVGKCFLLQFRKDVMFFSFTNKTLAILLICRANKESKDCLAKTETRNFSNRTLNKKNWLLSTRRTYRINRISFVF